MQPREMLLGLMILINYTFYSIPLYFFQFSKMIHKIARFNSLGHERDITIYIRITVINNDESPSHPRIIRGMFEDKEQFCHESNRNNGC